MITKPIDSTKTTKRRTSPKSQYLTEEPGRRRKHPPHCNFTAAAGKMVDFIHYLDDGRGWQSLEVSFTDGTLFSFDLQPQVQLHVHYMESRRGELEMIRDYGLLGKRAAGEGDD
jgi:hypothetical protein